MPGFTSFSTLMLGAVMGAVPVAMAIAGGASASTRPRVGEPQTHANLSVYFLRGDSQPGPVPLTLAEALAKGTVTVSETGNVNALQIENKGLDEVFIQAGDIVKGGQQDRVLTVSMLLSAKSGKLPIGAFCVEQGRWSARGKEDVKAFASAEKSVPSRATRLAILSPAKPVAESEPPVAGAPDTGQRLQGRRSGLGQSETGIRQGEVWANVGKIQEKLSTNLKAKVASGVSASSLQLSLENDALTAAKADYAKVLAAATSTDGDIIGVVFAINGRISSAEIYPSSGLFKKMWPKLLDAGATEAISEKDGTTAEVPDVAAVAKFLEMAEQGKVEPDFKLAPGIARQMIESPSVLAVATKRDNGADVHRTYMAK